MISFIYFLIICLILLIDLHINLWLIKFIIIIKNINLNPICRNIKFPFFSLINKLIFSMIIF